jgi:hypothetical protein
MKIHFGLICGKCMGLMKLVNKKLSVVSEERGYLVDRYTCRECGNTVLLWSMKVGEEKDG